MIATNSNSTTNLSSSNASMKVPPMGGRASTPQPSLYMIDIRTIYCMCEIEPSKTFNTKALDSLPSLETTPFKSNPLEHSRKTMIQPMAPSKTKAVYNQSLYDSSANTVASSGGPSFGSGDAVASAPLRNASTFN